MVPLPLLLPLPLLRLQAYFAASAAVTAAALLLYQLVLPRLDVVQYYRGLLQGEWEVVLFVTLTIA